MPTDPIVDEVRKHREAYAAKFNYDLKAIVADLKAKQKDGRQELVSSPPKRIEPVSSHPRRSE